MTQYRKGPKTAGSLGHMRNIEQTLQWKEVRTERQEGCDFVDWKAAWRAGAFIGDSMESWGICQRAVSIPCKALGWRCSRLTSLSFCI